MRLEFGENGTLLYLSRSFLRLRHQESIPKSEVSSIRLHSPHRPHPQIKVEQVLVGGEGTIPLIHVGLSLREGNNRIPDLINSAKSNHPKCEIQEPELCFRLKSDLAERYEYLTPVSTRS